MDETIRDRTTEEARPALVFAVCGILLIALHTLDLLGPLADYTFIILALGGVAGVIIGLRWWKPVPRWPWALIVGAMVMFLLGGIAREELDTFGNLTASRSLIPDLLTMPGYLALAAGLAGLARARSRGERRSQHINAVLDGMLAALAALTLAWVYLINPALSQQHVPLAVRLLLACYPPMSVFLVAIGTRMALDQGFSCPLALRLLIVAVAWMLVGDVIYLLVDAHMMELPRQLIDVPYGLAYVAFTAAVIHPSMRWVSTPVVTEEPTSRQGRLALVALALCVPALVTMTRNDTGTSDRLALAAIVIALTATGALRMFRALSEHARSEQKLVYQGTHDRLTGLPNRALIQEHLAHGLASQSPDHAVALLFIDIDRFKLVNDTMGHGMGDELLIAVARRLEATLPPKATVARVGGDEFAIVVYGVRDTGDALEMAERTRLGFNTPFRIRASEMPVTASIGVAIHLPNQDVGNAEVMFRDADTAMYQAKDPGGDAVALFDDSVRAHIAERVALEQELRHALERDQLEVHYQPVVHIHDGRILGMEALLRWSHPTMGTIRPDRFIPIAEDTGMIVEIGAWVIDQACAQLRELKDRYDDSDDLYVSVNLSARQLREDGRQLLDHVARALLRSQLPPQSLCLELTESMLMHNVTRVSAVLSTIREHGVKISVDDFGTGYSSLAYLKLLPVDEVKIDRSFVLDIAERGADASLVAAVVAIASSFGYSTVAEGVEDAEQAKALEELGCNKAQGYLYSRPVPGSELPATFDRLGVAQVPHMRIVSSA